MPAPLDCDCLIIGGGLVGASLACALADLPMRVAVVEPVASSEADPPSFDDRGLALSPSSQRILAGLQIWPGISPEATAIRRIHVSHEGYFGVTRLEAAALGVPALGYVVIARALGRALQGALRAAAADGDRLSLLCPARLESITTHPDRIEARIANYQGVGSVTTRLLVAADGSDSKARQCLGVDTDGRDYGQAAVVANISLAGPHEGLAYERFTAGGPLALLPLTMQRYVAVWAMATNEVEQIMRLDEPSFLAAIHERSGRRVSGLVKLGARRTYPLKLITARRQIGPRFVVLGNAAHTVHPNAAQGLNLALRDVAGLADCLAAVARAGRDPGDPDVLRRYLDSRRADQRRVVALSDGLARLFYDDRFPLTLGRGLAMLAIDLCPPLKRALCERAMGLHGRQARLARGLSP
ncbi:MAG: 2-octaprenyl-6-methoxyphenyl hydroxylase [Pseudomonadota bacterium]|nr:2-octaprenyl-6-methoxyphenyl hydroxylase [Gammaproteobacteria bacterium]MDQ3580594.1 2-octaprenyl-6-methoxyphenyl hydroxylase [Pseudomonadota bacterium]